MEKNIINSRFIIFGLTILLMVQAMPVYAKRIAILLNNDHESYVLTAKSICDNLKIAESDIIVDIVDPQDASIAPDTPAIIPLGSSLTAWAINHHQDKSIIFGMVLNPIQSGLAKQRDRGIQITGVSLDIPVAKKIEQIKKVLPNLKRIGLLVSKEKVESILSNEKKEMESLGYDVIVQSAGGPNDVPKELENLTSRSDLLWMVPDSGVYNTQTVRYLIPFSIKSRLPVLSLSHSYTEAGALMAVSWDFQDIGKQIAEMALDILDGKVPNQIPIAPPRKSILLINKRTADRIGITSISSYNEIEIVQR